LPWPLQALRDEMVKAGTSEQFDALEGTLTGEDESSRDEIAARRRGDGQQ